VNKLRQTTLRRAPHVSFGADSITLMAEYVRKKQGYGYLIPPGAFESSGTSEESSEDSIESGRETEQHQAKPHHATSLDPPAGKRSSKKKHRISGVASKSDGRKGSQASNPLTTSHASSGSSKSHPEKRHEIASPGSYLDRASYVAQPSVRSAPAPAPSPCERMYHSGSADRGLCKPRLR
jgi:hypothetical protein